MDFRTMLTLEAHGPDTWIGVGPRYPWGGLYGGQIVAQALRAVASTVPDEFRVHSLHAYFVRLGDADEPIRFEVSRLRNGRTFATRAVVVRQAVGAILNLAASFQVPEDAPDVQTAMLGDIPPPESLPSTPWSDAFDRRVVPGLVHSGDRPEGVTAWMRMNEDLGDDPVDQACGLAYLSDVIPTDAAILPHPDRPAPGDEDDTFWSASLDHAIWFHRPFRADEWHVHDFVCPTLLNSRGLAIGSVFTRTGEHVATITQEVLLRSRRSADSS